MRKKYFQKLISVVLFIAMLNGLFAQFPLTLGLNVTAVAPDINDPNLRFTTLLADMGANSWPRGLVTDASGNIFVSDIYSGTVYKLKKYSSSGTLIWERGVFGSAPGQLNSPAGLDLDSAGNVYVADFNNHNVTKYSSDGVYLCTSSYPISTPYDVTVDKATGDVFVTDSGNDRIVVFDSNLQYAGEFSVAPDLPDAQSICLDPSGNIYVGDQYNKKLVKYDPYGMVLTSNISVDFDRMTDLYCDGTYLYASANGQLVKVLASDLSFVYKWSIPGQYACTKNNSGNFLVTVYNKGVYVSHVASNNNYLSSLSVAGQTLSPAFNRTTTEYTVSVPDSVTSVAITATKEDPAATITVNGNTLVSGSSYTYNIGPGTNTIYYIVKSDAGQEKTYTINVNTQSPPDIVIVKASHSGYVFDGSYGTDIYVGDVGPGEGAVKFDLGTISQTVLDASLTLNTYKNWSSKPDGTAFIYNLYGSADDSWVGGTSFPSTRGSALVSGDSDNRNLDYTKVFNVKSFVTEQLTDANAENVCTFILSSDGSSSYICFYGSLNSNNYSAGNIPYLKLRVAAIDKATASFDKTVPADVSFNITVNDTLSSISLGGSTINSSNYTISGSTVTIKKEYLSGLTNGDHTFSVNMTGSSPQTLSINVSASVPDTTNPVIDSVTGNPTAWQNSDVTLTVSATDAGIGIPATGGYSFDGGATWQDSNSKVFSSNISGIVVKVKDKAGNVATYSTTINITKIDKAGPTITSVTGNPSSWQSTDVTLTISATDMDSGIPSTGGYSFDGGSTWQDTNQKTYAANTTIPADKICVKDSVGNVQSYGTVIVIGKIDKDAPAISGVTGNAGDWTAGDVTLTVSASDTGSGILEYSFNGGTSWQAENSKTYAANTVIAADSIKVKDTVGNIASYNTLITIDKIDKTGPSDPVITNTAQYGTDHWYKTAQTVEATFTPQPGSPERLQYSVDGAAWADGNQSFVSAAGTHVVKFRTIDSLNRTSAEQSVTVQVDITSPAVDSITLDKINTSAFMRTLNFMTFGVFFKEGFKVTLSASDSQSGVDTFTYNIGGDDVTISATGGSASFTVSTQFKGIVKAKATDKAGNTGAAWFESTGVINEANAPTVTITTDTTDWRNADFVLYAPVSDADSGINKIEVTANGMLYSSLEYTGGGYPITYTTNFSTYLFWEGNYPLVVKVTDNSGNVSVASTNVKLDKSAPTATVAGNPTEWTSGDVTLTVNASDSHSGVKEYSFDGGVTWQTSSQKTYTANQTITANTIQVKDNVGFVFSYPTAIVIDKIDKDAPTISGTSGNAADWTAGDVTLTISASDSGSGIKEYSFDGGVSWQAGNSKTYSANTVITANTIQVKDVAGNIASYNTPITIDKIDKTGPSDPVITNAAQYGTDHWYNTAQAIEATFTAQAGCPEKLQYSLDSAAWTDGTQVSVSAAGTHSVRYRTIDSLNRTSIEQSVTIQIDQTAPAVGGITFDKINTSSFARIMNFITFGQFFKEGFKVNVSATDAYGEIESITYNIGGSDVTIATSTGNISFTVDLQFKGTVQAKATDKAGNTSPDWFVSGGVINDPNAPVFAVNTDTGSWKTADFDLSINITDADAGIHHISVKVGSGADATVFQAAEGEALTTSKDITVPITAEGSYTVVVSVEDNSGNVGTKTIPVKLDKTKPVISVSGNPTSLAMEAVLMVNNEPDTSGISAYSFDNGVTWQAGNQKTFTENQTIMIVVKDNAGWVSDATEVKIVNVDKVYPAVTNVSKMLLINDTSVTVTCNKNGMLYLVPKGVAALTKPEQLDAAISSDKGKAVTCVANTPVVIVTAGLAGGKYGLYVVDAFKQVSNPVSIEIAYPLTNSAPGAATGSSTVTSSQTSSVPPSSQASSASSTASSSRATSSTASSSSSTSSGSQTVTYEQENKKLNVTASGIDSSVKLPEAGSSDVDKVEVKLVVNKVEEQQKPNFMIVADNSLKGSGNEIVAAFDISIIKNVYSGDKVTTANVPNSDIKGTITIRLPLPSEYADMAGLCVAYIDDSGKITYLKTKVVKDNSQWYLEFQTNHFSTYAIIANAKLPIVPNTGNPASVTTYLILFAIFAGVSVFLFFRYRRFHK